jgi:enoyl-CoA hydratase/carnithine racemase
MLDALSAALHEVATAEGPRALVTTGSDRFYSNGLDLDWLGAHPDEMLPYLGRVHGLFAQVLSMPCPTVAACNGHTFAAGAMLAIAHDVRLMRSDRGYWCLPEVDLGMPFTPGMNALIPARLPSMTAHEAMVTGRRYTADEAVAAGIVGRALPEAEVLPAAVEAARALAGKAGPGIATIRTTLHAPVLAALAGEG